MTFGSSPAGPALRTMTHLDLKYTVELGVGSFFSETGGGGSQGERMGGGQASAFYHRRPRRRSGGPGSKMAPKKIFVNGLDTYVGSRVGEVRAAVWFPAVQSTRQRCQPHKRLSSSTSLVRPLPGTMGADGDRVLWIHQHTRLLVAVGTEPRSPPLALEHASVDTQNGERSTSIHSASSLTSIGCDRCPARTRAQPYDWHMG